MKCQRRFAPTLFTSSECFIHIVGIRRDEDKREFLADISSFANTEGGDIVYGVEEDQGVITNIAGVACPDIDTETLRLENLARDGIAPRITIAVRVITCTAGRLLILRVERNWTGPHRVIFRGHDKFYGRTSAGKFALDVGQLRTAFLQSASITEKILAFRIDRLSDIANDRTPLPLVKKPKLVLHLIPLGAFTEEQQYDVTSLHRNLGFHQLWGVSGWDRRMTFDGILLHGMRGEDGRITSYAHFYRNGILEALTTSLLETTQVPGQRLIPHASLERSLITYLPTCFASLVRLGVRPPLWLSLTLIGVQGLEMAMGGFDLDTGNAIREENLMIPGIIVEDFGQSAVSLLRPMFDRIWNACGLMGSLNFDDQGNWIRGVQS